MKKLLYIICCATLAFGAASCGGDKSASLVPANEYFSKYLTQKEFAEMCKKSMPTKEVCKAIFKGDAADKFFEYSEKFRTVQMAGDTKDMKDEKFAEVRVDSFTTAGIATDTKVAAGGMKKIADKLNPVTFYKVNLLREKGAQYGIAFTYFVPYNGSWYFIYKPWHAFPEADSKDVKDTKDEKAPKDMKDAKDTKESKDTKDSKDSKDK